MADGAFGGLGSFRRQVAEVALQPRIRCFAIFAEGVFGLQALLCSGPEAPISRPWKVYSRALSLATGAAWSSSQLA